MSGQFYMGKNDRGRMSIARKKKSRMRAIRQSGSMSHFGQLVYPKINNHGGRIVKNTGDGLLAEFPSVLGVVRYAVKIQRGMIAIV